MKGRSVRLPMLVGLVFALASLSAQQQTAIKVPTVYLMEGSSDYHLKTCSLAQRHAITPILLTDVHAGPCLVCHPVRDPEVAAYYAAIKKTTDDKAKAAAEARAAAKAKADSETARKTATAAAERQRLAATPLVRITQAKAREIASAAAGTADNNPTAFQTKFRSQLRALAPDYDGVQVIESTEGLKIYLAGPLAQFEADAMERVRKFQPIGSASWIPEISIIVGPERIDSLDIEKVIVQRNGVNVAPLRSTLAPHELTTAMGAKKMIHAGTVSFPLEAFANWSGITVKVIAIPASGSNIVKTFDAFQLRSVQ
jgi:hypothetical protein